MAISEDRQARALCRKIFYTGINIISTIIITIVIIFFIIVITIVIITTIINTAILTITIELHH